MPVATLKRQTSSWDFVRWRVFLKRRAEVKDDAKAAKAKQDVERSVRHPKQEHHYLAQVAQYLHFVATREMLPMSKFLIPFNVITPEEVEAEEAVKPMTREEKIAEADMNAKLVMFARLGGTPENFEGFKK